MVLTTEVWGRIKRAAIVIAVTVWTVFLGPVFLYSDHKLDYASRMLFSAMTLIAVIACGVIVLAILCAIYNWIMYGRTGGKLRDPDRGLY